MIAVMLSWHDVSVADACATSEMRARDEATAADRTRLLRDIAEFTALMSEGRHIHNAASYDGHRLRITVASAESKLNKALYAHGDQGKVSGIANGLIEILREAHTQADAMAKAHVNDAMSTTGSVFDLAADSLQHVNDNIETLRKEQDAAKCRGDSLLAQEDRECAERCRDLHSQWDILHRDIAELLDKVVSANASPALAQYAHRMRVATDALADAKTVNIGCGVKVQYFLTRVREVREMLSLVIEEDANIVKRAKDATTETTLRATARRLQRETDELQLQIAKARRHGDDLAHAASVQVELRAELALKDKLDELTKTKSVLAKTMDAAQRSKRRTEASKVRASIQAKLPDLERRMVEFQALTEQYLVRCQGVDDKRRAIDEGTANVCANAACRLATEAKELFRSVAESALRKYRRRNESLTKRVADHLKYYKNLAWSELSKSHELVASGAASAAALGVLGAVQASGDARLRLLNADYNKDVWLLGKTFYGDEGGGPLTKLYNPYTSAEQDVAILKNGGELRVIDPIETVPDSSVRVSDMFG